MNKNMNRNRNRKMTVRKELVETFVEEWTESRVYMGSKRVASFKTEREAKAFVRAA